MSGRDSRLFSTLTVDDYYKTGCRVIQEQILQFDNCGQLNTEEMCNAVKSLEQAAIWFAEEKRDDEADHAKRLIEVAKQYLAEYQKCNVTFPVPRPPGRR